MELKKNMSKKMKKKPFVETLWDMGIIKRKLTQEEIDDIVNTTLSIHPPGDKALDLACSLAIMKVTQGY